MTIRDSAATRRRILEAATAEFASYGLAGARVDRIAEAAQANKNLIYTYFGNKDQLFSAVLTEYLLEFLEAVPFDANDLANYAGHLFDFNLQYPSILRLVRWYSLERPNGLMHDFLAKEETIHKIVAIETAQHQGVITRSMPAKHIYAFMLAIASTWSDGNIESHQPSDSVEEIAARRRDAIAAVRRLIAPSRDELIRH